VTAIALDGRVDLAWASTGPGSAYAVYRGTSEGAITTLVSPPGGTLQTSFSDTTVSDGTTYYYAVRATLSGLQSGNSVAVRARPVARDCATGNPVVLENCYPGSSGWPAHPGVDGIEGFATAQSVDRGGSVDLKVDSGGHPFHVEIYRSGYYDGAGARLISVQRNVPGQAQPACAKDASTGLVDCSNWAVSTTISTTASWTSGMYLLRIVRADNGADNHILVAVRDDARHPDLLYGASFSTYAAYNGWGGKSLYDFNSDAPNTVAGSPRAVKVSFDRPFAQSASTGQRDWYTLIDQPVVAWMEQQGYDVSYLANTDLERDPGLAQHGDAYVSSSHDEYWSAGMRAALQQARDAGHGLFFTGANEVYWKVRFEAGGRVMTCYKSTQSGPADPSGVPTGTWRDPAGANQPENALSGQMYVGDDDSTYFPFVVSAAQAADRIYRHTGLGSQPPGGSTSIGSKLVGWEWDAPVANGLQPPGLTTLSSSPVTGSLLQDAGKVYAPGSAVSSMVKYVAPSGALVVATGTNHWWRGLATNLVGSGEPDLRIQQITTNVLEDLGALPTTPASGIVVEQLPPDPPPASGGGGGASGSAPGSATGAGPSTTGTPAATTSAGAATPRAGSLVILRLREYRLMPDRFSFTGAGVVRLRIVNRGHRSHRLAIRGPGVSVRSRRIAPGRSTTLRVRLRRGRYRIADLVSHRRSMTGTITIGAEEGDPR
jgi:hypothetical protein